MPARAYVDDEKNYVEMEIISRKKKKKLFERLIHIYFENFRENFPFKFMAYRGEMSVLNRVLYDSRVALRKLQKDGINCSENVQKFKKKLVN